MAMIKVVFPCSPGALDHVMNRFFRRISHKGVLVTVLVLVSVRCASEESDLHSWYRWANEGEQGLLYDEDGCFAEYSLVASFAEEDGSDPVIYNAKSVAFIGDSMLVTDASRQCLVCVNQEEDVLWSYGVQGEGSGSFLMISDVVVFGAYVAVSDIQLGRVDIITHSGEYVASVEMQFLQSTVAHTDTSIIVMSGCLDADQLQEYDYRGDLVKSATIDTWNDSFCVYLTGTSNNSGEIAVFTTIGEEFVIVDSDLLSYREYELRNFPIDYPTIQYSSTDQGEHVARVVPIIGNTFLDSQGMISVRLMPFTAEKEFWNFDDALMAPVTVIDRYNWDGDFLCAYVILLEKCKYTTCTQDGKLAAIDRDTSCIRVYERI
ncbi:hypothetical protein CSA37_02400 [Candidatus Fermentibacteria bacterium]|nr:MAG: hypothetical protein CSA37_02400 [Candidatus Fermentibacteria bacterium]